MYVNCQPAAGDVCGASAADEEGARYAELTRRAGHLLYSRVGGDVMLSPLLARRPHVSTVRVQEEGGAGGCGPVSVAVSEPPRRRWSLADACSADGEEVGELMTGLEPEPAAWRSLPRRHTVSTCRQQLRAATVRSVHTSILPATHSRPGLLGRSPNAAVTLCLIPSSTVTLCKIPSFTVTLCSIPNSTVTLCSIPSSTVTLCSIPSSTVTLCSISSSTVTPRSLADSELPNAAG